MNPPLAQKLARMLGVSLPTDAADVIVRELQKACLAGSLAEREACARICETEWSTTQEHVHGLALADMIRDRANP
jgi:hypothetical protein